LQKIDLDCVSILRQLYVSFSPNLNQITNTKNMKKALLFSFLVIIFGLQIALGQTTVERNPFVKWKAVAKDLKYSKISFELLVSSGELLSNKISATESVVIKAAEPEGFVEVDGVVSFGIGVKVSKQGSNEPALDVNDIYKTNQTVDPKMLKSLTLKFSPSEDAQLGDVFLVTVRFFDKYGNGEIIIDVPFEISEKTDASNAIEQYTNRNFKPSYAIIGHNMPVTNALLITNDEELSKFDLLTKDKLYFKPNLAKNITGDKIIQLAITSSEGETTFEKVENYLPDSEGRVAIDFPASTPAGCYLVTVSVESQIGKIGFSEWFYISDAEISQNGREEMANLLKNEALRQMRAKNSREAIDILTNAAHYLPNNIEILFAQGYAYNELGKYVEAIDVLQKITEQDVTNFDVWNEMAWAYKKIKDFEKSTACYVRCTALRPNHYMVHYNTGWNYNELKKYKEALPYLDKAVLLNPASYKQPYTERIITNRNLGNIDMVVIDYLKLAEIDPENAGYFYQAGYYKIDLYDYIGAVAMLSKSIELDKNYFSSLYERGYAYKLLKKYDLAIADFKKAAEIGKGEEPPKTYFHLGDCYMGLKQKEEACRYYQKAATLNVANADAEVKRICGE
jgi:tetratricopeptide (TPR) repeat protein